MSYREKRQLKGAVVGTIVGVVIAVAAFAVIALITSASSIWWWLSAAAAGAVGGVTIGSLLAVERDDGEIHDARTAKSALGDADAPVERAERTDAQQTATRR